MKKLIMTLTGVEVMPADEVMPILLNYTTSGRVPEGLSILGR